MFSALLLILFWLLIAFYTTCGILAFCRTVRYRDVMVDLDAERIAHQPFQPKISVVVRCDLRETKDTIPKIQALMALNYTRYEVILIANSAGHSKAFGRILDYFEFDPRPVPEEWNALRYPIRGRYRSRSRLYNRLTIIDKDFAVDDDLRRTGAMVSRADYMLFVRSLNNELSQNSLSRLAIMKMRDPAGHVTPIRGVARYACGKGRGVRGNLFRTLMELCNLRRIYLVGCIKGDNFGQFVVLKDTSGKRGREEFVLQPQVVLHRPNRLKNYLRQLAPRLRFSTPRGRLISGMEFMLGVLFWATGLHVLFTPGVVNEDFYFLLSVYLLPLTASTFTIFVGEILLEPKFRIGFVFRLLLLSFVETLLFCLCLPWVWIVNRLSHLKPVWRHRTLSTAE
jgi:hypothetical protein